MDFDKLKQIVDEIISTLTQWGMLREKCGFMELIKIKLECIDLFYSCVDRDISGNRFEDYETSFEQVFVYDYPFISNIEKAVWCLTMVIRFARSGLLLCENASLEQETKKAIEFLEKVNWN